MIMPVKGGVESLTDAWWRLDLPDRRMGDVLDLPCRKVDSKNSSSDSHKRRTLWSFLFSIKTVLSSNMGKVARGTRMAESSRAQWLGK